MADSNSQQLGKAIADYRKAAKGDKPQSATSRVNRSKMIENSKEKFYSNLGMQYKKGEEPVEPAKRAASGSRSRPEAKPSAK
jgi:hypothetical protein